MSCCLTFQFNTFQCKGDILKHYTHKHGCGDLFTSQHEGFTQGNVPGLTNVVTKDIICAMLNTLYLHTSQSQSGHLMQYTRSFSLLTKTPSSTYNRLRELHKLLFYFIKDYWFKIKLCHDQSTLSDLHSTVLRVQFSISIFYSYKFPPSTKYVERCTFNRFHFTQLQTWLKNHYLAVSTIKSPPYRYWHLSEHVLWSTCENNT